MNAPSRRMLRPWQKEALICLGGGVTIVATLMGAALVFGAKMGSCGPSNGAAFFALAEMLPGLPVMLLWTNLEEDNYWAMAAVYIVAVLTYAFLVLIVRQGLRIMRKLRPDFWVK